MTDLDPLSRTGLIVGMVLALFFGGDSKAYDIHTDRSRMDTTRQELELDYQEPDDPDVLRIEAWVCEYGSASCGTDFSRLVVRGSNHYGVSPYTVVAIGVWESGIKPRWGRFCTFGYASCRIRFGSLGEEINTVIRTFAGYGLPTRESLAIWHTGKRTDTSGYVERVLATARAIEGR